MENVKSEWESRRRGRGERDQVREKKQMKVKEQGRRQRKLFMKEY